MFNLENWDAKDKARAIYNNIFPISNMDFAIELEEMVKMACWLPDSKFLLANQTYAEK